ncbi:hypothetical protein HMPREF9607_01614 [Cutibacterium modestum HL044PA1]|uniref:Uncharacterized protein n=1 Tax=Cutibacterium modestum HL044PA1 TaxID=765109 RepID=A0ABP2K7X6_9ACTN|nr:hypothetical protein HMPREF9607_01614 [Cutibacterium modestum HL044PA1]
MVMRPGPSEVNEMAGVANLFLGKVSSIEASESTPLGKWLPRAMTSVGSPKK